MITRRQTQYEQTIKSGAGFLKKVVIYKASAATPTFFLSFFYGI